MLNSKHAAVVYSSLCLLYLLPVKSWSQDLGNRLDIIVPVTIHQVSNPDNPDLYRELSGYRVYVECVVRNPSDTVVGRGHQYVASATRGAVEPDSLTEEVHITLDGSFNTGDSYRCFLRGGQNAQDVDYYAVSRSILETAGTLGN